MQNALDTVPGFFAVRSRTAASSLRVLLAAGLMLAMAPAAARAQLSDPMADGGGGGITAIEEAILGPSRTPPERPKSPNEPARTPEQKAKELEEESRLHLSFNVDFTNMYIIRGYMQESGGFIVQPSAVVNYDVYKSQDLILTANFGTWSSFHDRRTNAKKENSFKAAWYEADYTAGLSATMGEFTVGLNYAWYTSPSGAFSETQELLVAASYDDSKLLGAFAVKPTVLFAFETGVGTSDGFDRGTFCQFGISPGIDLPVSDAWVPRLELPVNIGLSLNNYYQEPGSREDETFGFVTVGPRLSMPLPFGDGFGTWTLSAAATWWFLGDHVSQFNDKDDTEVQITVGVSVSF